jgi:ABC-type transporter Mla subunit MlaD
MDNAVKTKTIKGLVDRLNKSTAALNKSTERLKATTQTNKRLVKKNQDLESHVRTLIAKAEDDEAEDDETGDDLQEKETSIYT